GLRGLALEAGSAGRRPSRKGGFRAGLGGGDARLMGRLDAKVALVTGAAHERGIGRGIVRALAEEGAVVAVNDVAHEEMGEQLAREVGGRFYRADVSRRVEVDELVDRV